jgi:hypothetical protein
MTVNTRVQDPQAQGVQCSLFLEVTVLGYFERTLVSRTKLRHIISESHMVLFAIQFVNLIVKSALIPLT